MSLINNRALILVIFVAIIILASFGFAGETSATYYATGTLISTNLLDGVPLVTSIDSFFASTTIPANTTLSVQFATSSAAGPWYDDQGSLNATTSIANGTSSTDLSGLGWSGANFYYKMYFNTNNTSTTPVLEEISVEYTSNTAPVNEGASIIDMDDSDNVYAQRKLYTASSTCSDVDGFSNIDYCELRLKQGAVTRAIFRYDEDTDTFSVESGSTEWDLDNSSTSTESGNNITISWKFMPQWDAVEEDDLEIELYAIDAVSATDTDTAQSNYVDVVTNLVTIFSLDDDRGNISQSITASGTVTYATSSFYPPDAEFTSISVYDSANNNEGTSTVANGDWSVTSNASSTVGTSTYNLYINMADADYTDGEEATPTGTFITDQVVFKTGTTLDVTDGRVNADASTTGEWYAELMFDYDDIEIESGTVNLDSGTMTWDAGQGRWEYTTTSATVQAISRNIASVSGLNYGITSVTSTVTSDSETVIYDRIKILTLSAVDNILSVGTQGTWYATAKLEYDNHGLGLGDSFTLSGRAFSWDATDNRFETTHTENSPQTVAINSFNIGSEATYGITVGNSNNLSQSIEWQAIGGGGGAPSSWYSPPKAPETGFEVSINNDAGYTDSPVVDLDLSGGSEAARMAISNFPDFRDAGQETYQPSKSWNFCQGRDSCPGGEYTVYVKFYTDWGSVSDVVSNTIIYKKETAPPTDIIDKITEEAKEISEKIGEVAKKITELFKPKPPEEVKPPEVPVEELVPKETPLVFQGEWQLLPSGPIKEFVLSPLPKEIRMLAQKFPELGETLEEVGVSKVTDVAKLKTVELTLPGLTERLGLPTTKVEPGKFALSQGVPVAELSSEAKEQIPSEIVFAKTSGELIDFNIALSVTEKGKVEQKITTISGKPLNLAVKPEKPVNSIKGYIIFKARQTEPSSFQLPLNSFIASLLFANPIFAQEHNPKEIEEVLVLLEFEYTDADGDGIYTADIQAPLVEGEYEIITVMDYEDPDLGQKEIRLITVVDPEGYVYEKAGNKETRIPKAIISLFWLNPETKQYELWPAEEYHQENPQVTDATGKYAFLVPNGSYYLKAEAPSYLVYDGKPFQVTESRGIHINIELKTKFWWLKILDWKNILLILVIFLLLYNFYRDKMREKKLRNI